MFAYKALLVLTKRSVSSEVLNFSEMGIQIRIA